VRCRAGSGGGGSRARSRPPGTRAAPGVPARGQVDEPRDVGGREQPALRGVLQGRGEQGPLVAAAVDSERDDPEEGREHQRAVDDEEVARARQRRGVPHAVQEGCQDEARDRREHAYGDAARGDGQPDPDADERGEERVREGADQAPQDERDGQRRGATRAEPVGAVVGGGEVEDVLGVGEPDAHHAGVDDAVEHPVELVAAPPQQQHEERALGELLGDRGDDGEAVALARTTDEPEALEDQCRTGRGEGAPKQAGDQQVARLGLVAVEPHEAADQGADRDGGDQCCEGERAGRSGERGDGCHHDAAEEHQGRDHHGEGDTVAAASLHGPDPNGAGPSHPPRRTPWGDASGPRTGRPRRTVTA
jgi:hypothetical protein